MGFIQRVTNYFRPAERRSSYVSVDDGFNWMMNAVGADTDAGVNVTAETAMLCSAVYACVNVISSQVSTLPIHVVDDADGQKRKHPLRRLLSREPNPDMTAVTFWETFMVNLLLTGRAYAVIDHDAYGRARGIYPLRSLATNCQRRDGVTTYTTFSGGKAWTFGQDRIIHVLNMSMDGMNGISPIECARSPIGISIALEQFFAKFFKNGANMGGIIEVPPMKPEAIELFKKNWAERYAGATSAFKTAVLTDGMKYHKTGVEPDKAQSIEARVHQIREVARIFRVPPHKIGDLERATFSNIEHQGIEFRTDTIEPWTKKIEQELDRKLLTEDEKEQLAIKFNLDAILRADTTTRYTAHSAAVNAGWKTVNEVRSMEGLPPKDGGDVLRVPANLTAAASTTEPAKSQDAQK